MVNGIVVKATFPVALRFALSTCLYVIVNACTPRSIPAVLIAAVLVTPQLRANNPLGFTRHESGT